eukprot:4450618-Alexandrium_andersonii.AAC.1
MSASLVGSEMCIRDSPPSPQKRLRRAGGFFRGSGGAVAALGEAARAEGAVSYTHLTLPTICSV